ncbi:MAG: hypothetical protein ABEJ83_01455 [Candidatus Nanohaloarchaea archaeon]
MENYWEALTKTLLVIAIVAVPTAASSVNIQKDAGTGLEAVIDSNFSDRFKLELDAGYSKIRMESAENRLEIKKRPDGSVKKLVSSKARLKVVRNPNTTRKVLKTAYGTLEYGVRNGRRFESFKGLNRSRVEEIQAEMERKLETKVETAREKKRKALDPYLPDIKIEVRSDGEEHFNLTNTGENNVSLQGWEIRNEYSDSLQTYSFGSEILEPGEEQSFYSKDKTNRTGTGLTLYAYGGKLTLYNDRNRLVQKKRYD